jgi:hypothetical protein
LISAWAISQYTSSHAAATSGVTASPHQLVVDGLVLLGFDPERWVLVRNP